MKKIFFYSSLLALATSCTDEFDSLNVQNEKTQGITFQSEAVESRMLWEDNGTAYVPFWFAEKDRIGIFALNATQGAFGESPTILGLDKDGWDDFSTASVAADAIYKATQSKKNGVFTSTADAKTLHFNGDKTAKFLAVYPSSLKANWSEDDEKMQITNGVLPAAEQTQNGLKGDNSAQVMYAMTSASRTNEYDAVGETVNLAFNRPMKALVFTTANANDYTVTPEGATSSIFGNLNHITVTTKGVDSNESGTVGDHASDIAETALSYVTGSILVDTVTYAATLKDQATPVNSIKLNINQEWNDEAMAIAAIIPNERKAYASTDEPWTIVYDFEKIQLTHTFDAIPAGTKFNSYMPVPALDIQDYAYLVTKGSSNDRALIVNSGTFANIFDETGKVIWGETPIAVTEFAEIIVDSDVVIEDADFKTINTFKNLTNLTLKGVTELKTKSLNALTSLTYINMPLVATIESGAFAETVALTDVLLPSFDFAYDNDLTKEILKEASLKNLDMSGVTSMRDIFPASGFSLANYTQLETVIVMEGVEVGPSAFYNCTNLKSIDKAVKLLGSSAFELTKNLKEIKLTETVIPVAAFKDSNIETLLTADGEEFFPTEIKNNAFNGAAELEYLDLSETTSIGENAFLNASKYKGAYYNEERGLNLLYVNATTIKANAFQNTALQYVQFDNLTALAQNMLSQSTATLKEIKFAKVLTAMADSKNPFGTATTVNAKLFLNEEQGTGFYSGKVFCPQGQVDNADDAKYKKITMSSIVFE